MGSHVTKLLADLEAERKALNKAPGHQLHSPAIREKLRLLAESYFNSTRPFLVDNSSEGEHIKTVDGAMQRLIELCHKRGSLQKYKDLLKEIKANLVLVDSRLIAAPKGQADQRSEVDSQIVATLHSLLPSAALSYEQALLDLAQDQRCSWRGPATDLREALRETLDKLAPDDDVRAAPGFKQEKDIQGPTMKQKVRFILKSREVSKAISSTTEDATSAIEEAMGAFVRSVYTRSSVSTHTPTNKAEVLRVRDLVRVVLCELLEIRQ